MNPPKQTLSVAQAAVLCEVNRNTIGSWIRSGKLRARRSGRNYVIPANELIYFLKSSGRQIPEALGGDRLTEPSFRSIENCWQYFREKNHRKNCETCTVFKNRLEVCFTGKDSQSLLCNGNCHRCRYYLETFFPRIQFIRQIDFPAAICRELYFWGGNRKWAELSGVAEKDLVGMGIEKLYHPHSLARIIAGDRKRALGNPDAPRIEDVYIKVPGKGKLKVRIAVYPLIEPEGTWLLLGEAA